MLSSVAILRLAGLKCNRYLLVLFAPRFSGDHIWSLDVIWSVTLSQATLEVAERLQAKEWPFTWLLNGFFYEIVSFEAFAE